MCALVRLGCVSAAAAVAACGSNHAGAGQSDAAVRSSSPGFSDSAIAELKVKGVDRYIGKAKPVSQSTTNGTTAYEYDPKDGPVCLRGDTYRVLVRDAKSENLLIYVEGGGVCFGDLCLANTTANDVIPNTGIFDNAAMWSHPGISWTFRTAMGRFSAVRVSAVASTRRGSPRGSQICGNGRGQIFRNADEIHATAVAQYLRPYATSQNPRVQRHSGPGARRSLESLSILSGSP